MGKDGIKLVSHVDRDGRRAGVAEVDVLFMRTPFVEIPSYFSSSWSKMEDFFSSFFSAVSILELLVAAFSWSFFCISACLLLSSCLSQCWQRQESCFLKSFYHRAAASGYLQTAPCLPGQPPQRASYWEYLLFHVMMLFS